MYYKMQHRLMGQSVFLQYTISGGGANQHFGELRGTSIFVKSEKIYILGKLFPGESKLISGGGGGANCIRLAVLSQ